LACSVFTCAAVTGVGSNVNFTSDYGLDTLATTGFKKLDRAIHHSVIRQRDRIHACFFTVFGETGNAYNSVEQRILRMYMKMAESLSHDVNCRI
jgi:hypothetical protein